MHRAAILLVLKENFINQKNIKEIITKIKEYNSDIINLDVDLVGVKKDICESQKKLYEKFGFTASRDRINIFCLQCDEILRKSFRSESLVRSPSDP